MYMIVTCLSPLLVFCESGSSFILRPPFPVAIELFGCFLGLARGDCAAAVGFGMDWRGRVTGAAISLCRAW